SGHHYFSLKDSAAVLKCILWASKAERLKFKLKNGLTLIVRGRLDVYPQHGAYSLHAEEITPQGMGQLELAFRQLYEKIEARGWFSEAHKKQLPTFPKRLGLVTSLSGAALRDMLKILSERWPLTEVWVVPVPVQGDQACDHIAETLHWLNKLKPGPDLLILSRGGGSMENLWAFNEEVVAHAIFHSRIPIITGIGHETDTTIADLIADYRAPTPTAAATRAVPDRQEWMERLRGAYLRLKQLTIDHVQWEWDRLERLKRHRLFANPTQLIDDSRQEVDDLGERLLGATQRRLLQAQRELARQAAVLAALSPLQVLGRGYSVTRQLKNGQPLLHSSDAVIGDELETILHEGRIRSRVESVS
ncbi:MAG TPA: exodeoxyribonuclease VII large subunit, partial [Gemmatales bacterium]|nr:exodeoxyribonuclease VII large subunit [Gemmatales bacterium]